METFHLPNTRDVIEELKALPNVEIGSYFLGSDCHVCGGVMKAGFDWECCKFGECLGPFGVPNADRHAARCSLVRLVAHAQLVRSHFR